MIPPLVQEPLPITPRFGQEQFVFLVCQHGVESCVKSSWTNPNQSFRLAFSRPGLLTLKIHEAAGVPAAEVSATDKAVAIPHDWMIRASGLVLGQVRVTPHSGLKSTVGEPATQDTAESLVDQAIQLAGTRWRAIHVFARDPDLPGLHGFEPGPTPLCEEIGRLFEKKLRAQGQTARLNLEAEVGDHVLDIVLVEPHQWLIGHHVVQHQHQRWPGGAYAAPIPTQMISRAYLKMAEAMAWSGLPIAADDWIVEIGSAPGGACQRLLDLGLRVTGVDPAEMDPCLLDNPRFEHWRSKSSGVRRKMYSKFRWLAADANVAPNYTLEAVEDIVSYRTSNFEGLLLTLKLSTYALADKLPEYVSRVKDWGFRRVEVRQLASNRRECCLVAQR